MFNMATTKRIYLMNAYNTFKQTDKYLYDMLEADGYRIMKTFWCKRRGENSKIKCNLRILYIIAYLVFRAKRHDIILSWDSDDMPKKIGFAFSIFRPDLYVIKYNSPVDLRGMKKHTFKWWCFRKAYSHIINTTSAIEQSNLYKAILELPSWHFHVLPDSLKNHPKMLDKITDRTDKGYIFSGGGAARDWKTLMKTACLLPQYKFKVATNEKNAKLITDKPDNVEIITNANYHYFNQLVANSSLLFIPLTSTWQGGVTVINDAAYLGKMSVTTDFLGIHGYYNYEEIVTVEQGNAKEAADKIKSLMENTYLRESIAQRANNKVKKDFRIEIFYNLMKSELFTLV